MGGVGALIFWCLCLLSTQFPQLGQDRFRAMGHFWGIFGALFGALGAFGASGPWGGRREEGREGGGAGRAQAASHQRCAGAKGKTKVFL